MTRVSAALGYELWAAEWDDTPSPIVALEERTLAPWIERLHPRCAVDVGCGTGRWTARLAALGVDAAPAMLAIAARKPGLHGRLAVADAAALPLASGSIDLVLCTLMLGHLRDQSATLREMARVLEPGGALLMTDFHPDALALGWRRTFRRGGEVYEIETYPYTVDELRDAAPQLELRECVDAAIGEQERPLFERAGRMHLYEPAKGAPAILLTHWVKS